MLPSCSGNSTASSSQLMYLWIAIAVIVFVIIMVVVLMLVIWSAFGHSHHQQVRDRVSEHVVTIEKIVISFVFLVSTGKTSPTCQSGRAADR